ncbi:hypothetical protein ACJX0J_040305, partial [Zea mays]
MYYSINYSLYSALVKYGIYNATDTFFHIGFHDRALCQAGINPRSLCVPYILVCPKNNKKLWLSQIVNPKNFVCPKNLISLGTLEAMGFKFYADNGVLNVFQGNRVAYASLAQESLQKNSTWKLESISGFLEKPDLSHVILRYLKGTSHFGLLFHKNSVKKIGVMGFGLKKLFGCKCYFLEDQSLKDLQRNQVKKLENYIID